MDKIAPHNTRVFQWFNFFHGLQFFSPIAVIYFAQVTGSYAQAASIISLAFISQVIFEIPTGVISDNYGRKTATGLGALSYLLAVTTYALGGAYWALLLGAILEGLRSAFFSGNNDSLLYESGLQDGNQKYHSNMGKTETYFHLAATLSAVTGGVIALASLRLTFLFSAIPALAMVICAFYFIEPNHVTSIKKKSLYHVADSVKFLARSSKLRIIALAASLEFGVGHAFFALQGAFINTIWPIWAVGVSRALSGLMATVSYAFSGTIIDRFGPLKTVIGSGIWSKLLALIALVKPNVSSPIFLSVTSLSFGSSTVAESTLLQNEFNSEQRATLGSITSLAGSFLFAISSITLGYLADHIGLHRALLLGLLPGLVTLWLYFRLGRYKGSSIDGARS